MTELAARHRDVLEASAISAEVIEARGYFTVERKADVGKLGFGPSLQYAPTLAIPVHGVVPGEAPWYMHRPDETPIKDGRRRKYLIPAGRKMALDVHPLVRAGLGDPQHPLFITEGCKKVDALVSAGAKAVVGLAGVWNWRGTNGNGGKVLLPDWEWVTLKEGRRVYVCFDSDVLLKEQVHQACGRLGEALKRMGAEVAFVYLPAANDGGKVGVDDFLAQGRSLADVTALATPALRLPAVEADDAEGHSVERILNRAKPWAEAVDGAALADDIKQTIQRHIVLAEAQAVAVTLWIFFSWVFDSARVAPLLFVTSPMPECGKTNVLTLVRWLSRTALPASNISGASIYHLIERHEITLVIDEVDSFLRDDERIAGIVNSGHTRDLAFVIRMHGEGAAQEPRVFSTWAPKALAGIGVKCLQPATRTRCIVIELERASDGADYEPLTEVDTIENPWPDLASRLARWADDFPDAAGGLVDMDGLARRTADNWRPMFAIADAIAGDWPRLAKQAAKELSDAKRVVDEDVKTLLLSDLRDIYGSRKRMHSVDIVEALAALEDRPWAEWGRQSKPITKTGLARLLGDFHVPSPVAMRIDDKNLKGYERDWLEPLFERYLAGGGEDETSQRHNGHQDWGNGGNATVTDDFDVTDGNPPDSAPQAGCDVVTDGHPPSGAEGVLRCPECGGSATFTVARDRAYCLPCSWHLDLPPEAKGPA